MHRQLSSIRIRQSVLVTLFGLGLSACGGGGGGGGSSSGSAPTTPTDTVAPSVAMTSPSFDNATTSATTTVQGTASDTGTGVSRVLVNGVEAQSDDGFDTWQADLPTGSAISSFTVTAEDGAGNSSTENYSVRVNRLPEVFASVADMMIDPSNGDLVILDASEKSFYNASISNVALNSINVTSGGNNQDLNQPRRSVVSSRTSQALLIDTAVTGRSASESLYQLDLDSGEIAQALDLNTVAPGARVLDMVFSPDETRIYLLLELANSRSGGAVWVHDTEDDSNTLLTLTETHSDPDFGAPSSLTISDSGSTLYYLDNDALIALDIETSSLRTLSNRNGAIVIERAADLIVSSTDNTAWVSDRDRKAVIEIALGNGSRRIVSDETTGSGPDLIAPDKLVYDTDNQRLLVSDSQLNLIYSVTLGDGQREYFISNRYGSGPLLAKPTDLSLDLNEGLAYVTDSELKAVMSVSLSNGNRNWVSTTANDKGELVGSGLPFGDPKSIAIDPDTGRIWVADAFRTAIFQVDSFSGDRNILDLSYASGSRVIRKPVAMDFDSQNRFPLVAGVFSDSVQQINTVTNEVSMLGDKKLSNGTLVDKPIGLQFDASLNKIFAVDALLKGVVEWDLTSGNSRVLSKVFIGQGVNFAQPVDIQIDAASDTAYVSDKGLQAIVSVDLNTGARTIFSGPEAGLGPEFSSVSGIAIDTANDRLYVVDEEEAAIYAVSLITGNRQFISR